MTSRAVHAVVAAGFAVCLPVELVGFIYGVYRHQTEGTRDVWAGVAWLSVLGFLVTLGALALLLDVAEDEATADRRAYRLAAWGPVPEGQGGEAEE